MTRLDGPDVSHFQYDDKPPIDWAATAAAGCWWGATKVTQSTAYLDPTAAQSRDGMRAAGFTHIGLYHWLSSTSDPKSQAAWFLANIGLLVPGEFVMLDVEEPGVTAGQVLAWCEAVEAVTRRPVVVYTGAYIAGGTIWQSTRVRTSTYGPRPMILAAYATEATARALPGVKAYPWDGWQFSSDGPVPGVTGRCDMDRIDNRPAFDLAAGITKAQPSQPSETDMPAIVTHSDDYDDADGHHPAGQTKWELLGGAKIHISLEYWNGIGSPAGIARPKAEIDRIPDYASTAATTPVGATHFTGTLDIRAAD